MTKPYLGYYKMVGDEVEPADREEALQMMTSPEVRRIGSSHVKGYHVSTVFLALDHAFGGRQPIFFETMIFGEGPLEGTCDRYATKREAIAGHARWTIAAGRPRSIVATQLAAGEVWFWVRCKFEILTWRLRCLFR